MNSNNLGDLTNFVNENWYGGQIEGDFYDHPQMTLQENLELQKKPSKLVWNWKHAIIRELMRGKHKPEILSKYKVVIDRFGIQNIVRQFLDKNDGVIGYFIVDVSNFDDKFTYNDIPDELKICNLYAMNATQLRQVINRSLVSQVDGSIDGFLSGNDNIDQQIYYYDECTGLPCIDDWNGQSDDDDERLQEIAKLFLGKKWMTIAEKEKFNNMQGKLPYLVSLVKRSFAPKSNSSKIIENDIQDFNVQDFDLEAVSIKSVKQAQVNNIHEAVVDDIGHTAMPEKYDIKKEFKKSDFKQDVFYNKNRQKVQVNNIHEAVVDDIGHIAMPQKYDIKKEFKKSDFKQDVVYDKNIKDIEVNNVRQTVIDDIGNISMPEKYDIKKEFKKSDFYEDVQFDNFSEFVIEDIKDMKDDEFDFGQLSDGDVDIDEMFDYESDKNEVDIDSKMQQVEISNKYDWSWE